MLSGERLLNLRSKAIHYRKNGYSYNLINQKLGVAKSTLNGWLRDIPYKPNLTVLKRIKDAPAKSAQVLKRRRIENLKKLRSVTEKEIGKLSKRDLWMLGIGLYIGEGSKGRKGSVRIVNSDPEIIKMAMMWFRKVCGLGFDNFSLAIHTYPDNDLERTIQFWFKITGIPKRQFGKTQIDRRKNKSIKNRGRLPYGTAHLTIRANGNKEFGVHLFRRIIGWSEAVVKQVHAGMVQW